MQLDIYELRNNNKVDINKEININLDLYHNESIKNLKNVTAQGQVYYDYEDNLIIDLSLQGIMILEDAYTMELVDYDFRTSIDESLTQDEVKLLKNDQISENTLDITDILWQNIVLEVPISFSKEKEMPKYSGEGWELVKDNDQKIDPRLAKLAELLEEGKE